MFISLDLLGNPLMKKLYEIKCLKLNYIDNFVIG
jgi:hypothetical protein